MLLPRLIALAIVVIGYPAFGQWQKMPAMPEPSAGFACGADDHGLIVIGGTRWKYSIKNWLGGIHRFDPQTVRWSTLGAIDGGLAYAVCDTRPSDGALVILGGSNGKAPLHSLLTFNKTAASTEPASALPPQIVLSAGGIIGDDFIVTGGTDDAANIPGFTNRTVAWNLRSKTRTTLPNYPGKPFAMAAAAVLGRELFIFGGANPINGITNTAEAYAFSHATRQWRKLAPCPIAARGAAAIVLDDRRIYLAGGYGGSPEGFLTKAFIYDSQTDAYAAATPLPVAATASLIRHGGFIYCLGGEDNPKSRTDAMWRILAGDLIEGLRVNN